MTGYGAVPEYRPLTIGEAPNIGGSLEWPRSLKSIAKPFART